MHHVYGGTGKAFYVLYIYHKLVGKEDKRWIFITKLNHLLHKYVQLHEGFAPWPLTRGFAPGPHWGQSPQTPIKNLLNSAIFFHSLQIVILGLPRSCSRPSLTSRLKIWNRSYTLILLLFYWSISYLIMRRYIASRPSSYSGCIPICADPIPLLSLEFGWLYGVNDRVSSGRDGSWSEVWFVWRLWFLSSLDCEL